MIGEGPSNKELLASEYSGLLLTGLEFSHYNEETFLFEIYPYHGNFV